MNLTVDGLIFDLDNTLFDFDNAFAGVVHDYYEQHLQPTTSMPRADAVAMMIRWDHELHSSTEYVPDLKGRRFARWLSEWPDTGLDITTLNAWYDDAMDQRIQPDPEVNGLLSDLNHRRMPWGIVTNGPSGMQRHKCEALGLNELAPFIVVSEEVVYAKPDPRIFHDALERTRLARPKQVMFVGDSPVGDIDGARRFGMRTAWVRRGRQFPADLPPPDLTVDAVTEVRRILDTDLSPDLSSR